MPTPRTILMLAAASALGQPAVTVLEVEAQGRVQTVTFDSTVLQRRKRFCVVLPDEYSRDREDWPVLVLLHGRGRHERSLVDDEEARNALLESRAVVVLPDGDDGWYINAPNRPQDRYEDYLSEVIAVAEQRYRLSPDRARRGLSGWSMGGYGATRYATRHPDRFGALAPMIGLLDFPRDGLPDGQSYDVPAERFGNDPRAWPPWNPRHAAAALRGMRICIVTATRSFDRTMNRTFSAELDRLGIEHDFREIDGRHTFPVVQQALHIVIAFMNTVIAHTEPQP